MAVDNVTSGGTEEEAMRRWRMALWMTLIAIGAVILVASLVPGPWR